MPCTKFPLHLTYGSGADNNWRLSRWLPSWIRFWWKCRKCEKLLTDIRMRDGPWSTDHGISWQLQIIKMAAVAAIVDIVTKWFSKFWISMSLQCLPPWRPSCMAEWNEFSISESPCLPNASLQVKLNSTYRSGADGGHFGYWNGMNLAILNL